MLVVLCTLGLLRMCCTPSLCGMSHPTGSGGSTRRPTTLQHLFGLVWGLATTPPMIPDLPPLTLAATRSGTPGSLSWLIKDSCSWTLRGPRGSPYSPQPTKVGPGCWHWGQSSPPSPAYAEALHAMLPLGSITLSSILMGPPIAIAQSTSVK
jgi:hypothetical protein